MQSRVPEEMRFGAVEMALKMRFWVFMGNGFQKDSTRPSEHPFWTDFILDRGVVPVRWWLAMENADEQTAEALKRFACH